MALAASATALGALALGYWDSFRGVPPERTVRIFRTHGCRCAFAWADGLRARGFVIKVSEVESLQHVRESMRTPTSLRGCHVARYLDYFLEGHIGADALQRLARERPRVHGIAAVDAKHANTDVATNDVVAFDVEGRISQW